MQSASYIYNRCQPLVSTDCVTWTGLPIPCLGICTNDSLTAIENKIATALCTLIGETDMSSVTIPQCLQTLWGTTEPSIKNLFALLLEDACAQQSSLDALQNQVNTIDPLVTVDYRCCSANSCVTTGTVKLSVALQNIINCLCDLNTQISGFNQQISTLTSSINSLNQQIGTINQFITTQTNTNSTFATAIQSLENSNSCIKSNITAASSFPINLGTC